MLNSLIEIYWPPIGWTLAGLLLLRFLPKSVPRLMGRSLYWVGIPLQLLAFLQRSEVSNAIWLVPGVVIVDMLLGLAVAWAVGWRIDRQKRGGFLMASILGNTGFVGLAVAPYLIDDAYLSWLVLYSLANNSLSSYGLGVAIASYYGEHEKQVNWLTHLRSVLTTPALWTFALALWLKLERIELATPIAEGIQLASQVVVPVALLLVGIRLRQITSWKEDLAISLPAAAIKLIFLPLCAGLCMTVMGVTGMPRLAMVLQAGMPTALAGLILAEEYNVNDEAIVLSIALTSIGVLTTIPLWLWLFGTHALSL